MGEGSALDPDRFDRHQIRQMPLEELGDRVRPYLERAFGTWHAWQPDEGGYHSPEAWFHALIEGVQEELTGLADIVPATAFALAQEVAMTAEAREILARPEAPDVLEAFANQVEALESLDYDTVNAGLKELRQTFKAERELSGRQVMFPIRSALTGRLPGPCLARVVSLLGRNRCLARIRPLLSRDAKNTKGKTFVPSVVR